MSAAAAQGAQPRPARAAGLRPPLARSHDRVVAGVVAGVARHLDIPVTATRLIFVGLGLLGGSGVALYLFLWITMPSEERRAATETAAESRARSEERARMAAHLHDSVLQTLALIQTRAGASSEVGRIARAQERELRDWLFAGASTTEIDLATELRDHASALELAYPVRFEIVGVGAATGSTDGALAAAAREAMLNAARHVGGAVSVYVEVAEASVDVFVRDRGAGFDLDAIPGDRLGIRESIVGRMRRAGGTAVVGAGAGGVGTEVQLSMPRPRVGGADGADGAGRGAA